jgi:tetratricopeptide (TPR) repeat protein
MATPLPALLLLEQALDLPADQRAPWLRAAAGDDTALRDEALALLQAHADSVGLLEPAPLPARLGPWTLARRLGAGGMGEVFLAERDHGDYRQRAALKLCVMGAGGPAALARFHAERQFLARLEHPNIARVIDGGTAPDGRPYVVMEYVDGAPIDRWCATRRLPPRERVRLFLQVLAAVGAAHQALILHRDIKPGNVMVDDGGQVKLLDFGIAKSLADGPALTGTGLAPLTPQYASPEQLAGEPLGTASDVYALGLLLHGLLTGRLPFTQAGRTTAQMVELLRSAPLASPSAKLDVQALGVGEREAKGWRRSLAGDLDQVLRKALAADPVRRYASAEEFAADLERWLDSRPVAARRGEGLYRARLFLRRNRLVVAASSAAVLALAVGLAIAAQQAIAARQAAERAESARGFLLALIADANPVASGREPSLKEALDQALPRIPEHFVSQPDSEADVRLGIGLAYTNLNQLDAAEAQFTRALALRTRGTPAFAEVLQARALLAWTRGRTDAAEADYRAALAVFAGNPSQARAAGEVRNELASLMSDLGRFDEAVVHAQAAVDNARTLQLEAGALGARLENLGSALQGLGRLDDADAAYREALAQLERALPQRTVAYAVALNNFALVQRDRGELAEALALFQRAVQVREAAFGADHGDLAGPLVNTARLQAERGEVAAARSNAARAVDLASRHFAPDYIGLGHVHLGAAEVALAAGDAAATRRHAEAALAVFARADAADPGWSARAQRLIAAAAARGEEGDATSGRDPAP